MRYEVDLSEASKFARTPAYGIPVIRAAAACGPDGGTLGATNCFLTRDGSPWIPIAGEMHYSRIAAERWDTELAKMAAAGIDVVSTYVFWNHHEEREGEWDFSGNRNVRRFVELCAQARTARHRAAGTVLPWRGAQRRTSRLAVRQVV